EHARRKAQEILSDLPERKPKAATFCDLEEVASDADQHLVERAFVDFVEDHLVKLGRTPRYINDNTSLFRRFILPEWAGCDLRSITSEDVKAAINGIVMLGTPIQANRTLSLLKRWFRWAVRGGLIERNPATGVREPVRERDRERVLSDQ